MVVTRFPAQLAITTVRAGNLPVAYRIMFQLRCLGVYRLSQNLGQKYNISGVVNDPASPSILGGNT